MLSSEKIRERKIYRFKHSSTPDCSSKTYFYCCRRRFVDFPILDRATALFSFGSQVNVILTLVDLMYRGHYNTALGSLLVTLDDYKACVSNYCSLSQTSSCLFHSQLKARITITLLLFRIFWLHTKIIFFKYHCCVGLSWIIH